MEIWRWGSNSHRVHLSRAKLAIISELTHAIGTRNKTESIIDAKSLEYVTKSLSLRYLICPKTLEDYNRTSAHFIDPVLL